MRPKFLFPVWERSQFSPRFFEMADRLSLPPAELLARNNFLQLVIQKQSGNQVPQADFSGLIRTVEPGYLPVS